MKHEKDKVYNELDRRLRAYADNSMSAIPIDETVKDRIWNNLNRDIHEQAMRRRYKVRKTYRLAFIISVVLVLIVSLDLSSNASLFKRLLTTVTGNTLQFHSRDADVYVEERDEELDSKISAINENQGKKYMSPIVPESYEVVEVQDIGDTLIVSLISHNGQMIEVSQKSIGESSAGTSVKYDTEIFKTEKINKNGIEYSIFKNDDLTIGVFIMSDLEIEVLGKNNNDVLRILMALK